MLKIVKSARSSIRSNGSSNNLSPKEKGDADGSFMPDTDWPSIYVASILSFVGTVQFSLYFSSLWPYVQIVSHLIGLKQLGMQIQIDRSINETQFGWIIAIYSVGQIISAPLFGYWSNRIRQVRTPLYVGLALMFAGNLCYLRCSLSNASNSFFL